MTFELVMTLNSCPAQTLHYIDATMRTAMKNASNTAIALMQNTEIMGTIRKKETNNSNWIEKCTLINDEKSWPPNLPSKLSQPNKVQQFNKATNLPNHQLY